MTRTLDLVREFHRAFNFKIGDRPHAGTLSHAARWELIAFTLRMEKLASDLLEAAGRHPQDRLLLRLHLCQEELSELAEALVTGCAVEALDALCDMRYVADGIAVQLGMADVFDDAFEEVHRSNMSKLENGFPVFSVKGRLLKGPNYSPPALRRFVR